MSHLFVRRYNPAYDIIITRRLKERGVELPARFSRADINARLKALSLKGRDKLSESERLLQLYLIHQGPLEEHRPGSYGLLEIATGMKGQPDVNRMRELEAELPPGSGKFVYTANEVGQDIADFYDRYLRRPLGRDLEHGETGRKISNYF